MTTEERKKLRVKIIELIDKSKQDIVDMEGMTQPIAPENSIGRISRMDAINNKSVMEAALRNKRKKLSKLRLALENSDKSDFGKCNNCGKDIQQARLVFMPESSRCVRCADLR